MTTEEAFGLLSQGGMVFGEQFGPRLFRIKAGEFQAFCDRRWHKCITLPTKWFDPLDETVTTLWGTVTIESAGNA